MAEVTITIRDDGPLLVQGPFRLLDADGKELPLASDKPAFAFCRCGASQNKPFCDGAHKQCDFRSTIRGE